MSLTSELISASRSSVLADYESAKKANDYRFLKGDVKATSQYIYPNQMEDAHNIVDKLYNNNRRVISIQKKTKVGADGLMIEIAKLLTTHIDDTFILDPDNIRIITGMSNVGWETDMKDKAPNCFKNKIFHHGKLSKTDLRNLRNGLVIIDEIDTGDKEFQVLHRTLKEAGVLNVRHMQENNNRFVFISATMIKELYHLYHWGELHELYKMTIPASYFGHNDFLELGIVKEFYSLSSKENAEKWVREDIIENYGTDYRIHIIRVTGKMVDVVMDACIDNDIVFKNYTTSDLECKTHTSKVRKITEDEIDELFKANLNQHIVIGVKGFFRRANLIPNQWKLRIGATHELYTKVVDNNVQIQGLTGRMTGYWRSDIEGGHKTGPHRTSIKAIKEYEKTYLDPYGLNSYQTAGFKKKNGMVTSDPTMLSAKHIENLEALELPMVANEQVDINLYRIYSDKETVKKVCKMLGYTYRETNDNEQGFKETSLNNKTSVVSLQDAVKKVHTAYGTNKGVKTYRTYYPCYVDTTNNATLRYVVIIRPDDEGKMNECDEKYPSIKYSEV